MGYVVVKQELGNQIYQLIGGDRKSDNLRTDWTNIFGTVTSSKGKYTIYFIQPSTML